MRDYNPYKLTALKRKKLSLPMEYLLSKGLIRGKVLDYGCGNGQDVDRLKTLGYDIMGYDKYNKLFNNDGLLLDDYYDTITCIYVLNVIPDLEQHQELLNILTRLGKDVYIAIRSDKKSIKENWVYINEYECYKTSKGSYQRFYDIDMVKRYFKNFDIDILKSTNNYIIVHIKQFKVNK